MNTNQPDVLLSKYPKQIPIIEASKILGTSPAALRSIIKSGNCPFGLCYSTKTRTEYIISSLAFSAWLNGDAIKCGLLTPVI